MEQPRLLEWTHMTSGELDAVSRTTPAVLPLGSTEAHGHHLPMGTDAMIAEKIARRACEQTGSILLPTLPFAYLGGTKNYVGALHINANTCMEIIKDIVHSVYKSGFKKIIFFNGHGPNIHFLDIVTRSLLDELEKDGLKLQYRSWWDNICRPYHACETETSMVLAAVGKHHLRKDKIIDNKIQYAAWRVNDWSMIHPDTGGVNGTPSLYNLEDGLKFHKAALEKLVSLLENAKNNW
jgi:creatinine amidohydrolase